MKIILLRDVAGVGQRGTVRSVSDGYAVNFLIPRKLAEMATPLKVTALEKAQKEIVTRLEKQEELWKEYAERLTHATVTMRVDANKQGQLYQQVPGNMISDRLKVELGISIPKETIHIDPPIRHIGTFPVVIRLGTNQVKINVIVERRVY